MVSYHPTHAWLHGLVTQNYANMRVDVDLVPDKRVGKNLS